MVPRTRTGVLGLVAMMTAPVAVAGIAWACGPSGYGVPETPAAPPPSTAQPQQQPAPTVRPPAPSEASGPARAPAAPSPTESGSATARSRRETAAVGGGGAGGGSRAVLPPASGQNGSLRGGTSTPPASSGQADINARVQGATAGVVRQGQQSVFASSATGSSKAKGARSSAARSDAAASESSAASEGWSGVTSTANPSLSSAAAIGEESGGGLNGGLVAGISILALGLVGIAGSAVLAASRRRRAGAAKQ